MTQQNPPPKKACILIVDDDPLILSLLEETMKEYGCDTVTTGTGAEALVLAKTYSPDLILLDIQMPEMSGYQVCEQLKRDPALKDVAVIFISGLDSTDTKVKAFEMGGVDYITKPFHFLELQARVGTHLNLCSLRYKMEFQEMVEEKVREVSEAQQATIFALAKLAEFRDGDTGAHLERVREYCRLLAEKLYQDSPYSSQISEDFVQCIPHASPLHDIGKVAIPDSILLKEGPLTAEEFEVMKTHTIVGAENLQTVYNRYAENIFIGMGIEIALYHHERWDGKGYPDGLLGKNIPLSARITALADFYDALCSDRCYRPRFEHEYARALIIEGDGAHFDPEIVKAFLALEEEFKQIMRS